MSKSWRLILNLSQEYSSFGKISILTTNKTFFKLMKLDCLLTKKYTALTKCLRAFSKAV